MDIFYTDIDFVGSSICSPFLAYIYFLRSKAHRLTDQREEAAGHGSVLLCPKTVTEKKIDLRSCDSILWRINISPLGSGSLLLQCYNCGYHPRKMSGMKVVIR